MTSYRGNEKSTVIPKLIFFSALVMVCLLTGCSGKDKVKPSEDSLVTGEALKAIHQLKDAYEKKDISLIESTTIGELMDEIEKELFFDDAHVTFSTPRLVRITDTIVKVSQNWHAEWTVNGKKTKSRGVSNMIYGRESGRLIRIEGDNPFRIPVLTGAY